MNDSLEPWLTQYRQTVEQAFQGRIWFMGLQGSYGRGEATEHSDIDVVLILDTVSPDDLEQYSLLLDTLPMREKVCGFVSGKRELFAWERSDLFQFCRDTVPLVGSLDDILAKVGEDDVRRAIRIGACNLYHLCAHNLVHEKSAEIMKESYKLAAFTLQAIAFWQTGRYEKKKEALLPLLAPEDRAILQAGIELKEKDLSWEEGKPYAQRLLLWASRWIGGLDDGKVGT